MPRLSLGLSEPRTEATAGGLAAGSLALLLLGLLILGIAAVGNPANYYYLALAVGVATLWVALRQVQDERRFLGLVLLVGALLRLGVLATLYGYLDRLNGLPFLFGPAGDDYFYHSMATEIASAWHHGRPFHFPDLYGFSGSYYKVFPYLNAAAYYALGAFPLLFRLLNLAAGVATCALTYRIAKRIFDQGTARIAVLLVALSPELIFWSATQYKDTLLALLLLLATWLFLKWEARPRPAMLMAAMGTLAAAGTLRFPAFIQGLLILSVYLFFTRLKGKRLMALLVLGALAGIIALALLLGSDYLSFLSDPSRILGKFTQRFDFISGVLDWRLMLLAPLILPLFMPFVLMLPIPLFIQMASPFAIINQYLLPGAIAWQILLPFFAIGTWKAIRERHAHGTLLAGWIGITVASLVISFLILTFRHRVQMIPFQLILTAYGLHLGARDSRIMRGISLYLLLVPLIVLGYNLLRLRYGSAW